MAKPKLLLLDEPSLGLAPLIVEKIFEIISHINQAGTTIFLVEQNANLALSISKRAYVMESGKITLQGASADLIRDENVRKAYLGEA
jgi:branched-chain amino acid transport system ATP-binding protein